MSAPHAADVAESSGGAGPEAVPSRPFERRHPIDLLACVGLFVFALLTRLLPWHAVYRVDGVIPFGNDAFYHLRRIQYSVANFPLALTFDPFLNFPHGAQPIWPPGFDWLLAAIFRALLGSERPEAVERLAMLAPPILGACTVVLVYWLGRRFFSRAVALLAASILVFLPAHFYYSQLGFLDHHVLVAMLTLLMLFATMDLLRASGTESTAAAASSPAAASRSAAALPIGQSVILGLTMAGAVLIWPGCLIHVGIVQLGLVVRLLCVRDSSAAVAWSRCFALVHLWACVVVLPFSAGNEWLRWGRLSPLVLSDFQPIYFGTAALCFGVSGELWRRGGAGSSRLRRGVSAGGVAAALLGGLLMAVPELLSVLADAWSWLAKEEAFQAVVNESRPLFSGSASVGRTRAVQNLSLFVYAVPLAVGWCAWKLRDRPDQLFLCWWALALYAATLNQWRFMNSYAIAHVLLFAVTLGLAHQALSPRLKRLRHAKKILALAAIVAVVLASFPVAEVYRPYFTQLRQALSGQAPVLGGAARSLWLVVGTARWLRENSPPPERSGYSVLGPWGDGHILSYVAQRPVVQDNFGDDIAVENFELAEAYFSARSERAALEVLARTKTRYVLVRSTGSGHTSGYAFDSLHSRLFHLMGTEGQARADDEGLGGAIPALAQHRLIYESPALRPGAERAQSFCKLYEIVAGARLEGDAEPGTAVQALLPVRSRHGEGFYYSILTHADASGRYALRLPYSNDRFSSDVRVGQHYTVRSENAESTVVIPEGAVRAGRRIEGPSLRSPPTHGGAAKNLPGRE